MKTTDYDIIGVLAPLDGKAATVRDSAGEHWDPQVKGTPHHWLAPPPMLRPNKSQLNFVGRRQGRLTAIAPLDTAALGIARGRWAPTIWVCRCTCGAYEGRKAEKLLKAHEGMCEKCMYLAQMQARAAKPSTAKSRRKDAARLSEIIAGAKR